MEFFIRLNSFITGNRFENSGNYEVCNFKGAALTVLLSGEEQIWFEDKCSELENSTYSKN